MLKVTGLEHGELLEATMEGTGTEEDMLEFREAMKTKTLQEEPISVLVIFKNIEGVTKKALVEDMKNTTFIKSVKKGAIVADDTFNGFSTLVPNLIPGVEIEQFPMNELEKARKWVQE